jgi:hypothetical protein
MYVERLQVESEGFLAGLDVVFSTGLNVIIGARGTGKTSLIELIRFCLNADAFTEEAGTRGNQQAIAILDGGAVTVTVRDREDRYEITRSAAGHHSYSQFSEVTCTVLAQNEVEAVGAQASGRLHLIDRFRPGREADQRKLESAQSRLKSLTVEIAALIKEGTSLADEIEALGTVDDQLALARAEQARVLEASEATDAQQLDLRRLQDTGRLIATRDAILSANEQRVTVFIRSVEQLRTNSGSLLQAWPQDAGEDLLAESRRRLPEIAGALQSAMDAAQVLASDISTASEATQRLRASVDAQSRQLRQLLETVQAGIGQATRRVADLEEKRGKVQALQSVLSERRVRYDDLVDQRDSLYRDLDHQRTYIYDLRRKIADELNQTLGPMIRVRVSRSENIEEYRSAIIAALRGSGIHYNTLAPQIAKEVSPYELARWIEKSDTEALASALSIRTDRAQSIVSSLAGSSTLASIISANIEDGVALDLLDGLEYKPSDQLSIGQRCTVVLPVLLGNHGDPLIVDQPEDHLDNAFIASTLVKSLRTRHDGDQLIFSSHNANIPVLGEANRVVVMQSDGEHGFVAHQGSLDDPEIVKHITQVMEGGIEAFAARSAFYEQKGIAPDAE